MIENYLLTNKDAFENSSKASHLKEKELMIKKRCPWCGKKIHYHYDSRRVKQNKLPRFFHFARCSNCDKYYGQAVYVSKYMKIMFYLFIPTLIATYILEMGLILITYLIMLIPSVYFIPFKRMNENEEFVQMDYETSYLSEYEGQCRIKKNRMYFLTDKFDEYSAFSTVSPVYIDSFNKKSKEVSWHFLYEHPDNQKYTDQKVIEIYDSDMNRIGKLLK